MPAAGFSDAGRQAVIALPGTDVLYRTLIEQLPTIIYIAEYGAAGKWHYVSSKIRDLLGYTAEEWAADPGLWVKTMHPEDRERVLPAEERAREAGTGFCFEYRLQRRDGKYRWFRDEAVTLPLEPGSTPLIQGLLSDIHESKLKEQALRESEERLRYTLSSAPLVVFSLDTNGIFLVSEGRGLATLGLKPGQVVGQSIFDLYSEQPEILANYRRALLGEEFTSVNTVSPQKLTFETAWMPLWNSRRQVVGVTGIATDITERKRAEAALRESEERLRLALGAAQMGVWEWDATTNRTTWDANLHRIMGVSPGAFQGPDDSLLTLIHPEDRDRFLEAVDRSGRTGEFYHLEFRVIRPDGRMIWISDQGRAEQDATGKVLRFRGVARDVSQQRELLEQLHRAQKMEAIGQLAGGVAHDFNNLLTVIRGHAEILLGRAVQDPALLRDAEAIQMAADRAATITQQLLAFSRKQVLQPRVVDLCRVAGDLGTLLRRLVGSVVEFRLELPPTPLWVRADESQLEQVVLNLVVNARDAMPQGGTVTVTADRVAANAPELSRHPAMPKIEYVRLRVSDVGIGMSAATQARIFEPFFTTKELGKGTGLGLATVYGIIKQSEGWIWVDSAPGAGATFDVFLPAVAAPEQDVLAARTEGQQARGSETILLVDDEEGIREVAGQVLAAQGYKVLTAESGARALEMAAAEAGPIHALITDAFMPRMGGPELAKRVRELRPQVRVLYISGYAEDADVLQDALGRGGEFLQKPFTLEQLCQKLRALLVAGGASQQQP